MIQTILARLRPAPGNDIRQMRSDTLWRRVAIYLTLALVAATYAATVAVTVAPWIAVGLFALFAAPGLVELLARGVSGR